MTVRSEAGYKSGVRLRLGMFVLVYMQGSPALSSGEKLAFSLFKEDER